MAEGNIVDLLQQEFQELAESEEVYIPVIGHEKSGLAIKYILPENGKVLDIIANKVERETKDRYYRNLWIATDTMIALCDGLFVKPEGVEEYVMLDPQDSGMPVKFDARLATIVGIPEDSPARTVLKKVFGNNEMAVTMHSEKLGRWIVNTKADLTVELWQLGEG